MRNNKWIFISGCNNSGTTLLSKILASHPDIASMDGEGQTLTQQLPLPDDLGLPRLWSKRIEMFRKTEADKLDDLLVAQKDWQLQLNDLNRTYYLEKSPPNSVRTRWLQAAFPRSVFIGIIRNGYAVAEGIRRRNGYSIESSARHWADVNRIMVNDWSYLEHKLLIKYEQLTLEPANTIALIFDFLGILYDDRLLQKLITCTWNIHDYQTSIHNLNQKAIEKLDQTDISTINSVAGDMLKHFDYI